LESLKYKLSNDQISTTMAGESVILNHKKGEYYTLNEVGSTIWDQLKIGPKSLEELITTVLDEYEITPEECQKDLKGIINELLEEKLIEISK
jgi:Coenzyme PQQ synthesis protein D (PqqD)